MPDFITFFIIPLTILVVLVLVHELGHFLAAKKSGIYVEEFGFGIPPRLFGIKLGETLYSINALPLGGFVRVYGEEGESKSSPKTDKSHPSKNIPLSRAFYTQNAWVKSLVIVAGVIMNLILAIVLFSIVYTVTGIPENMTNQVQIAVVAPDSPAESSHLQPGDIIRQIGTPQNSQLNNINDSQQFINLVKQHKGTTVELYIERFADSQLDIHKNSAGQITEQEQGERLIIPVEVRENPPEGQGSLGVEIAPAVAATHYPIWQMLYKGPIVGIKEAFNWIIIMIGMLGSIFMQMVSGVTPQIGGPVAIFHISGEAAKIGLIPVLRLAGILSINLAVLNILPIPALDGGRLAFILLEGITGKKIGPKFEYWVHTVGFILLLTILVLVSISDVNRIFGQSGWILQLKNFFGG